jgi:hypothetical protein
MHAMKSVCDIQAIDAGSVPTKKRTSPVKSFRHRRKSARSPRQLRQSGNSDNLKFERTRFGRRPVSQRKARVVAGVVAALAGLAVLVMALR